MYLGIYRPTAIEDGTNSPNHPPHNHCHCTTVITIVGLTNDHRKIPDVTFLPLVFSFVLWFGPLIYSGNYLPSGIVCKYRSFSQCKPATPAASGVRFHEKNKMKRWRTNQAIVTTLFPAARSAPKQTKETS